MTALPVSAVRDDLPAIIHDITRTHEPLVITRDGESVAVLLSAEDYDSIMEMVALLEDSDEGIRRGRTQRAAEDRGVISDVISEV